MNVSIIIVSWNGKELLRRCLASVHAQVRGASFEVIVIDNASTDGSAEMVAREFPSVTLVANARNAGFAAACNEGIRLAAGEHVLLLNPDTELRDDAVSALLAELRTHPEAGIIGPRMMNTDGSLQPSVRRFPTLASQVLIMLKLHRLPVVRRLPMLARYFADDMDYAAPACVEQVMGAAFLIRGSALARLGPLDERYFIWFEEVDYCKRAADLEIATWYVPAATITHHGGASFAKELGVVKQRYFNASLRTYMRIHHGWGSALVITALHPVSLLLAWLVQSLQRVGRHSDRDRT